MKFLGYILRNARRNRVRTALTVASITVCLGLMMILLSFLAVNDAVARSSRETNRLVVMSSQGFAQPVPISLVREVAALDGVAAVSTLSWYGGKLGEETMPFAQFGVDSETFFTVYDELSVPPGQLKAFQQDRAGCVIGRKLAEDRRLKVGDPLPLKGDIYPFDLDLTIRGIYDGPSNRDLRMCVYHWEYLDEGLKRDYFGQGSGNAGTISVKVRDAARMPALARAIDELTRNSDTPTRTQTEEAFVKMFSEMMGDLRSFVRIVGLAVVFSLVCVSGVSMAMTLRERTTEVAVLKAIGYPRGLVLYLVLAEAVLVAGIGGVLGALGAKFLFDLVDISRYTAGFLPFFFVPWPTALLGLAASALIGLVSGLIPAVRAARMSVIDGLRKVV
ncbi:MAG TPA: ABC transporter permease [Isosphaeraceae bacterium]|jgi:putative ABC transport system permease protein